ncbi:MAG TPA: hypothetical protein VD994_21880 [Prosthecobacter sp.]|nr:hypothetical protein [Prosthecobacter sp.]
MKIRGARQFIAFTIAILATTVGHTAEVPSSLLADQPPSGAVSVVKARQAAKPGEAIVVRGKIGGRAVPLMDKAAIAVLVDEKAVAACNENPADACKIPWDYCCERPEKLKAATATVQVRGENGKVLRAPLRGLGGLKELSTVIVSGTIDASSTKDSLVINATSIHVVAP